jgi:hypothetical protein
MFLHVTNINIVIQRLMLCNLQTNFSGTCLESRRRMAGFDTTNMNIGYTKIVFSHNVACGFNGESMFVR